MSTIDCESELQHTVKCLLLKLNASVMQNFLGSAKDLTRLLTAQKAADLTKLVINIIVSCSDDWRSDRSRLADFGVA
jgi:hypothetical protein